MSQIQATKDVTPTTVDVQSPFSALLSDLKEEKKQARLNVSGLPVNHLKRYFGTAKEYEDFNSDSEEAIVAKTIPATNTMTIDTPFDPKKKQTKLKRQASLNLLVRRSKSKEKRMSTEDAEDISMPETKKRGKPTKEEKAASTLKWFAQQEELIPQIIKPRRLPDSDDEQFSSEGEEAPQQRTRSFGYESDEGPPRKKLKIIELE